jgi:hypothetical protein
MVRSSFSYKIRCLTVQVSIKRDIGHLCHDEQRPKVQEKPLETAAAAAAPPPPSYTTPGTLFTF